MVDRCRDIESLVSEGPEGSSSHNGGGASCSDHTGSVLVTGGDGVDVSTHSGHSSVTKSRRASDESGTTYGAADGSTVWDTTNWSTDSNSNTGSDSYT